MDINELSARAFALAPWMTEMRRALHRIPEGGFQEFKTQALILRELREMGIACETHRTWIVAEIKGSAPGPTVALRADMDALPIHEDQACPFASQHEGWMHACGHDFHMAIQLGCAKILLQLQNSLKGSVRLLFQPAEETVGGAQPMVAAGVMDGVDAVYGLHVQPYMKTGRMDTRSGCLNASTDEFRIVVQGVSGHAARPEQSVDAIVCAAQLISALQTVVSRSASPLKPAVLSIGTIRGGEAPNVICDCVEMRGTLRTADADLRKHLKARIIALCSGIGSACEAKVTCSFVSGYDALINTPQEVDRVLHLAQALLGPENALLRDSPSMGGEDFSFFLEKAPGVFWHLGCSQTLPAPTLHSKDFSPDEGCLPYGAALQCALVLDRMGILE